ncbi:MAG: DUF2961 domain-containing protein [Verrucomicrobia bacterium]|nr:DUF2961 domain-containing protein [Verrucomicrobiota bacterium]
MSITPSVAVFHGLLLAAGLAGSAQAAASLAELARPHEGRSMRATSTMRVGEVRRGGAERRLDPKADPKGDLEEASNWDNFRVPPGETHVLLDAQGPGIIQHLWITFLGPEPQAWAKDGSANHQEMLLKIYWDGRERPGVEAPLGDFFANCFGKRREVLSLPVAVEDADSYNCFWQMPFRKSARIEIENQSDKPIGLLYYNVDWLRLETLPEDTPYFHAHYRQEYPAKSGQDYLVLDTVGKGHYVGTVLAVRSRSPSWFGEGDEKIYLDGETKPSIWGTGTEDYFLSAWGLKTTSTPYFGVPYFDQWGIVGGHTSAYRWHIADPIVFQNGIRFTFEHFGWISPDENPDYKSMSWNEREDDYASVAFWYQTGEPQLSTGGLAARAARPRAPTSLPGACHRLRPGFHRGQAPRHGPGDDATARSVRRAATALSAGPARGGVARVPSRGDQVRAAAALVTADEVVRFRPLPGLARRREAGRALRCLQPEGGGRGAAPAGFLARARHVHRAIGVRGAEPGLAGLLPGNRVRAVARTPAAGGRLGTREGSGLAAGTHPASVVAFVRRCRRDARTTHPKRRPYHLRNEKRRSTARTPNAPRGQRACGGRAAFGVRVLQHRFSSVKTAESVWPNRCGSIMDSGMTVHRASWSGSGRHGAARTGAVSSHPHT